MNTIKITILALLALTPAIVMAHGGEQHVMGTVAAVSDTSVTVKTTAGKTVVVAFDAKTTTYARAGKAIGKADIKVGEKVVIHAVELKEKLVAHTVELGTVAAAKH